LTKVDFIAFRSIVFGPCVLVALVEYEICALIYQFLHRVLHELVERVKLLSYKTLLVEERRDNCPAILLSNFVIFVRLEVYLFLVVLVILAVSAISS
jgi:hypothetical protein